MTLIHISPQGTILVLACSRSGRGLGGPAQLWVRSGFGQGRSRFNSSSTIKRRGTGTHKKEKVRLEDALGDLGDSEVNAHVRALPGSNPRGVHARSASAPPNLSSPNLPKPRLSKSSNPTLVAMRLPRRVPWEHIGELEQVCSWIYTDENDLDAKQRAVNRVSLSPRSPTVTTYRTLALSQTS